MTHCLVKCHFKKTVLEHGSLSNYTTLLIDIMNKCEQLCVMTREWNIFKGQWTVSKSWPHEGKISIECKIYTTDNEYVHCLPFLMNPFL